MIAAADSEIGAILTEQADRLFQELSTRSALAEADRGTWPAALWRAVDEAGFVGAMLPEESGGAGLHAVQAMRLVRRASYYTLPLPLGETILALALWGEAAAGPVTFAADTVATADKGHVLNGTLRRVAWGGSAHHLLVADGTGKHLALVAIRALRTEPARNLANELRDTLHLDRTVAAGLRPMPAHVPDLMTAGAFLRAQQMVGAMERCLDHAIAYANERKQFGRPIGKFQAIQQMLAEAAGHFAAAQAAADMAAEAWDTPGFAFAVAIAKARVGEAAGKIAEVAHQVHGAMGFTQEHLLHYATRRLWSWRDEFGHEPYWQERIGRLVCTGGGEALWPMLVDGGR